MLNEQAIKLIKSQVPSSTTIVAATKTVPPQEINKLKDYGITIVGENRVQELLSKYDLVTGIDWHFIGRLQTNKVKYIVDKVKMIQSVDKPSLADEIQLRCQKINKIMDVLIEINVGESSKGGILMHQLNEFADYILKKPNLNLQGIMCLPAYECDESQYKMIADKYNDFKARYKNAKFLSLGMSNDYKIAVKYGANMIRPGSILFGNRG